MAETAAENKVRYEVVADMGSGLVIAKVHLADIREQDINARIMKNETQKQLTDNIKKRGSSKASRTAPSLTDALRSSLDTTASAPQRTAVSWKRFSSSWT